MVLMILLTYLRWVKCLFTLYVMNVFGDATSRLSARRSMVLARLQMAFERTRAEALKNLKQFRRGQMTT